MKQRTQQQTGGAVGMIGVDVDNRCVRAAQVTQRGSDTPAMPNWLVQRRHTRGAFTPAEARTLATAMWRAGFKGRDIVLTCRDEAVISAVLELPPRASRVPVEHLARMEMARIHRKDPKDFVLGLWETPSPDRAKRDGSMYAFVSAMSTTASEEHASAFDSTGYQIAGVLPKVCALARACGPFAGGRAGLLGVVALHWDATHIALLHADVEGQIVPVYERVIEEIGLGRLATGLELKFGTSEQAFAQLISGVDERTIARPGVKELLGAVRGLQSEYIESVVVEVQRSFGYAVPLYPSLAFQGVNLVGEGAGLQGLCERTAYATGVDVRASTMEQVLARQDSTIDPGLWYAAGASVRGAAGSGAAAAHGRAA